MPRPGLPCVEVGPTRTVPHPRWPGRKVCPADARVQREIARWQRERESAFDVDAVRLTSGPSERDGVSEGSSVPARPSLALIAQAGA